MNREINWTNTLYLVLTPIIAIFGVIWWVQSGNFNYPTLILATIMWVFLEVSITAGYHRLFSHRTYDAHLIVQLFFLIFGAAAFQGPALHWSLDHRDHHQFVDDNEKDPYSINKGFWWAHIIWLFFKQNERFETKAAPDLKGDKWVMLQQKYYVPLGVFVSFVVPTAIAAGWGDMLGGFLVAGVARSVFVHHCTFLINSLAHCVGDQTYSDSHSSRDNWFTAILTFGEGYHNFHHEFASDYRNGVRFYHWDPTKWIIHALSWVGLTSNLKRVKKEVFVKKRIQMMEKRLAKKVSNKAPSLLGFLDRFSLRLRDRIEAAFQKLTDLRREYQALLDSSDKAIIVEYEIKSLEDQIKQAQEEFKHATKLWQAMSKRIFKLAKAYAN